MRRAPRVALTVAALVVAASAPAPAIDDSQGEPGFCQDDDGVTVVVDLTELGGEVIVRCAPGTEQRTGYEALEDAGFEIEGTTRFGQGTVCRVEGLPASDQSLAVDGKGGYREQCVDMPPASAYWSYWSADNGGSWNYSQYGVQNRDATNGGFEGWSFALNSTAAEPSSPRVQPVRPTEAPDESSDDSSNGSDSPEGGDSSDDDPDSGRDHGSEQAPDDGGDRDTQKGTSGEGLPKPMKRESSPPPTAGEQNGVEWSGGETTSEASSTSDESGSEMAPWVAGGVIAVLAILIGVTTVRRRARRGAAS